MSCQRLNTGFSPSSPDNNNNTNLYNKQFDRIIYKSSHEMYYDINKSKEFIKDSTNNNLMTGESYNLLMDMIDSPKIKVKEEGKCECLYNMESFNDYEKKSSEPNHLDKVLSGLKKIGIDSNSINTEGIKKIDFKTIIMVILIIIVLVWFMKR